MSRSVLLVVTHLLGVGHLARTAAIGRGLAAAGHRVTLVSGGLPAPLVATDGLRVVQLPPVCCRGTDFATLLAEDGTPVTPDRRQARIAALLAALDEADPDIVVTETYPFGRRQLSAEFGALLEACARRERPPCILASIRDILNPPAKPQRGPEVEDVLGRFYDGVLVHGDEAVAPLSVSWPVTPALARHLVYTGYVVDHRAGPRHPAAAVRDIGEILVSGGGSAAGLPLYRAAIEASALDSPSRRWRILVGHGVGDADFEALRDMAGTGPRNVVVERARKDFPDLLAAAAASVSQAGYNTAVDLAVAGTPAVLVPFEQGKEAEQRLRAQSMAERGLADIVGEADLSGPALAAAVDRALRRPRSTQARPGLGGIAATGRAIEAALGSCERRRAAWARLDAALDAAREAGRILRVWWRDDDVRSRSPALDRLLALARRYDVPVALAAIPMAVDASLGEWIAGEPLATLLVHGYAHINHAPLGSKPRELGDRPADIACGEMAEALRHMRDLFGSRVLPVMVPPWNRIDSALVSRLAPIGYRGLSVDGNRASPTCEGLVMANVHWDPIDWRGSRSLADEAGLIGRVTAFVEAKRDEPFGLLTHHRVHDGWIWGAVERLLIRLRDRSCVDFVSASGIFPPGVIGTPSSNIRVEP